MIHAYSRNKIFLSFLFLIGIVCICFAVVKFRNRTNTPQQLVPTTNYDLNKIKARGKLIALTDNSSTSFYIYKGDSMGYEYELLHAFAEEKNLDLEMVVAKNMNEIFNQLNIGQVDIVAANQTQRFRKINNVQTFLGNC